MSTADEQRVFELGQKISDELRDSDLVGRWMAQYIAEKLVAVEQASDESRERIREETAAAIIQLWTHRDGASFRRPPLNAYDRVLATVGLLLNDAPGWFFGRLPVAIDTAANELTAEREKILSLALQIETGAFELIRLLVGGAALRAVEADSSWVDIGLASIVDDDERAAVDMVAMLAEQHRRQGSSRGLTRVMTRLQDALDEVRALDENNAGSGDG